MSCNKALLLFFALLLVSSQPGIVQAFNHGKDPVEVSSSSSSSFHLLHYKQDTAKKIKSRKLLEEIVQLDYDYAGPNPKHNPRRGGGSRNP